MKFDGFLVAMLVAVVLALAWPQLGAAGGPLPLKELTLAGVAGVFFLHGANLSRAALASGAANWKLHLFIQSATYILFPLLGVAIFHLTRSFLPLEARVGILFLSVLSSTISSSVAMVAVARGNVAAAVFNASLSGILGMVLTPLLLTLLIDGRLENQPSVLRSVLEIATKLLLPFILGQLARPLLTGFLSRHKKWLGMADRGVILMIVYASFCQSAADGLWSRFDVLTLVIIGGLLVAMLLAALAATWSLSRALGFNREDEIAAVFCGSYKSLANGAPIAQTLFGANPAMGMIILPLMIYHQLQILVCSVLAQRYAMRPVDDGGAALARTALSAHRPINPRN